MGPTGEQWWCPHHIQTISILPFLLIWIIFWIESQTIIVNWIIYWIESQWFIWIWIIFWIEFSLNDFELNIELNQFCAKFKLWIESIWVSNRAMTVRGAHVVHSKLSARSTASDLVHNWSTRYRRLQSVNRGVNKKYLLGWHHQSDWR